MLSNEPGSISNTHPDVLWRQRYGKAAQSTKKLFVQRCVFHTQHSGSSRQHSSQTNIYPSFPLNWPCWCHRTVPLFMSTCGWVCLQVWIKTWPTPFCSAESPLLERRAEKGFIVILRLQQLTVSQKKGQCSEEKRIMNLGWSWRKTEQLFLFIPPFVICLSFCKKKKTLWIWQHKKIYRYVVFFSKRLAGWIVVKGILSHGATYKCMPQFCLEKHSKRITGKRKRVQSSSGNLFTVDGSMEARTDQQVGTWFTSVCCSEERVELNSVALYLLIYLWSNPPLWS